MLSPGWASLSSIPWQPPSCCLAQSNSFASWSPHGLKMVGSDLKSSHWWGQYKCMKESNCSCSFLWAPAEPIHKVQSKGYGWWAGRKASEGQNCQEALTLQLLDTSGAFEITKYGRCIFTPEVILHRQSSEVETSWAFGFLWKEPECRAKVWALVPLAQSRCAALRK